jgi:uncharacterized protein YqgQ
MAKKKVLTSVKTGILVYTAKPEDLAVYLQEELKTIYKSKKQN